MHLFRNTLLLSIFFLGIFIRFLYFPNDINFAYDQSRDAFISLKVLQGDFVTVGPPTTFEGIHHGALFYYFFAPFYWIANGSPFLLSGVLRIVNALGIFLVFKTSKNLFDRQTAYVSSIIYAISFEQSQFSIFLAHPSAGVATSLIFFWGMTELIYNKKPWGMLIASIGLGLSSQMHFSMLSLFLTFIVLLATYRRTITLSKSYLVSSIVILAALTSTFWITELKFDFLNTRGVLKLLSTQIGDGSSISFLTIPYVILQYFKHNILDINNIYISSLVVLLFSSTLVFSKKKNQLIFLFIWLAIGVLTYLPDSHDHLRYSNAMGTSVALVIFLSFILSRSKTLLTISVILISYSNLGKIFVNNPKGNIPQVNAQTENLWHLQKKATDYIYVQAKGAQFSVNAITVPYNVATTPSYILETYGQQKYSYTPVWAGEYADGFEGNLKKITARSEGPPLHFLIIHPSRGLPDTIKTHYITNEDYFTKVVEERQFGMIKVQKRVRY